MYITSAFKNSRKPFNPLVKRGAQSLIAAWRGVKNSARVVFIGQTQLVANLDDGTDEQKSLSVKLMYDLIQWFGMNTQVIRVSEFSHHVVDLPPESKCRQALHLAHNTGDHVREGNLVMVEVAAEQLGQFGYKPLKALKEYKDFDEMVQTVGFRELKNKNFQSVMKKQTKSFLANYDECMHEVSQDFVYTELQVFESFVQDWFVMNLAYDRKTKKFFALIQPDLVRSYTLQIDFDRNTTNRVNLVERVHAYVDRYEDQRFFLGNSVWQVCLALVMVLSVFAVLYQLVNKPESEAEAAKKAE